MMLAALLALGLPDARTRKAVSADLALRSELTENDAEAKGLLDEVIVERLRRYNFGLVQVPVWHPATWVIAGVVMVAATAGGVLGVDEASEDGNLASWDGVLFAAMAIVGFAGYLTAVVGLMRDLGRKRLKEHFDRTSASDEQAVE